jgi:RNA polymerase sigma-70 factor (ECF subfamily)
MELDDTAINELILRSQQGDKEALGDLLRSQARLIQSVSARMTRNIQAQEDIFQDVVVRVIRGIKDFKGTCKFSTWLYRITVNVTLTALAKEGWHKKTIGIDDVPEQQDWDALRIDESLERKEMFRNAMSVVMNMSEQNKEIFSMFYFADTSIGEIATQTGKSQTAIKAVLFKGRKEIVARLKKQGLWESL